MAKLTVKELEVRVSELEKRIVELESMVSTKKAKTTSSASSATSRKNKTNSKQTSTKQVDSKESKKTQTVVGNLIFCDKYVKTGDIKSKKTRYAIQMSITKDFGGIKLGEGNPVYDKCKKQDKYVQVYEFKTVADCKKFMAAQEKRVG